MTREDFAEALRGELLCRCVSFDPAEVREFVRDVWPRPANDPDPERWVRLFLVVRRLWRAYGRGPDGPTR